LCTTALVFSHAALLAQADDKIPYGAIVREIKIEGLKKTREHIVTRELISQVGEPYLEAHATKELAGLRRTGLFSDITVDHRVEGDSVTVVFTFVETLRFMPGIGIHLSEENGVSYGGGVRLANALGKNITLKAGVAFGGVDALNLGAANQWVAGNHLSYDVAYSHAVRDNELVDVRETADELYVTLGSYIGETGRIGLRYAFVRIGSDQPGMTLDRDNGDQVARVGVFLGYDTRDQWIDTRTGWWNEIVLEREMRIFGSNSDFWEFEIDLRRYQEIADRHVLAAFSLTSLRTGAMGEDVARWQQYSIGGTNTVRGWDFASRIGKNQSITTLEYRYTLVEPKPIPLPFNLKYSAGLQLAVFGDAGVAWSVSDEFATDNFIGGYGLGVRLLLPAIGMLRFDLGWGQGGRGISLHIGSLEKAVAAKKRVR
jgi:outer membrane protein assembly factor BamA